MPVHLVGCWVCWSYRLRNTSPHLRRWLKWHEVLQRVSAAGWQAHAAAGPEEDACAGRCSVRCLAVGMHVSFIVPTPYQKLQVQQQSAVLSTVTAGHAAAACMQLCRNVMSDWPFAQPPAGDSGRVAPAGAQSCAACRCSHGHRALRPDHAPSQDTAGDLQAGQKLPANLAGPKPVT